MNKIEWTKSDIYHTVILILIILSLPIGFLTLVGLPVNVGTCFLFYVGLGILDYSLTRWVL